MSEPASQNPVKSKRSKRKPAMEPLGWDEIVSQPGMGGYLSFLNGPVPLPHLEAKPAVASAPGVVSDTANDSSAEVCLVPAVDLAPVPDLTPASKSTPDIPNNSTPGVISTTEVNPNPGAPLLSVPITDPGVLSAPVFLSGTRLRIRRCTATHEGHSLGEEVLYQALWKAALPETADTRQIVIGWRGMSQLCRMTPKNCKINTQRLIRKLALEVLSPYNTPESIGTTYRVYSVDAIFERRRRAGLEWVVRSRGVEFVNPATGASILPICAPTH